MDKRIALGADHGGFALKEKLIARLNREGYSVHDAGTKTPEPCDYPRYGFDAAGMVSSGKAGRAILVCRSGIGMAVIGNKLPGVRAGVCNTVTDAVSARQHNDTNVLVVAADRVSSRMAMKIMDVWLTTPSLKGRHARRVKQIKDLEKKVFRKTGPGRRKEKR
jgi:ribose 5-phosphate isomerase B